MSPTTGPTTAAPLTNPDHFTSQAVFRVLLGALAEPGLIVALPAIELAGGHPALAVPLTLAAPEVDVAVLTAGDEPGWAAALGRAVGAPVAPPERAAMVVALRPPTPDEVRILRRGRNDAPELGARLVVACETLTDATGAPAPDRPDHHGGAILALRGPGVPDERTVRVEGVPVEVFEALASVNRSRPTGVDAFLVDRSGRVVGLPRSTRMTPTRITSGG